AGRRKRRDSVLSFLGCNGIWICVPADFVRADCVPCSPVHAKTVLERRNERRSFFYKKKKNLCTASCEHGRSGSKEIYVCEQEEGGWDSVVPVHWRLYFLMYHLYGREFESACGAFSEIGRRT